MSDFSPSIVGWYRQNKRELPWRNTKDPYFIWLSEIILQQTRVEQGTNYYLKFTKNYPTVSDLANAKEIDILNDWQGLGYYSRARNLHFSAQYIQNKLKGEFPLEFSEIIKLKGVGKYTASAISSFAFNEVQAVVDGNVYRLLSRVFDIDLAIDSGKGQKYFQELADELIDKSEPATHNQAIMEVGSQVCTPKSPNCDTCPISHMCLALKNNSIEQRPVKTKKIKITNRFFHYLVFIFENKTYIEKRNQKGIWQNMYQFPLIETASIATNKEKENWTNQVKESESIRHILSHQKIDVIFHHLLEKPKNLDKDWQEIELSEIQDFPLPRIIDKYLEDNPQMF